MAPPLRRVLGLLLGFSLFAVTVPALGQSVGGIVDIGSFLESCPTNDINYGRIRSDFKLRRNGILVGSVACSEPVSAMSTAQYTDEIIVLQGLRVIYYMDRGMSGHLPWTSGTLYDWMKEKIDGIDIRDGSGSFCCLTYEGLTYIAVGAQNDFNRDFDKSWMGISGNIGLYAHETRHVDGFGHTSCCGLSFGCDDTYSESNAISPYGIQWFLERKWLFGDIYVGFSCLPSNEVQETANWHLEGANGQFRSRFCSNLPPLLSMPDEPGGECLNGVITAGHDFFTLTPCRLFDSRNAAGPLPSSVEQSVNVHGICGVPATARAIALNVTATGPTSAGYVTLYPGHLAPPRTSTLNFSAGQTRANNVIMFLALDGSGTLGVVPVVTGGGTVHVIVDAVGYFE
jgi:hypothetical protein